MNDNSYNYITVEESQAINYFRIPKQLFTDEFKEVSTDAKLLYGLMLERTGLSQKNGWINEKGYVYIIYTVDELSIDLNCSNKSVIKYLVELKSIGLIEIVRRGLGKPNLIYVKSLLNVHFKKCKKFTSRSEENTSTEVKKVHGNKTDMNKPELNNNITPIIPFEESNEAQDKEPIKKTAEMLSPFDQFWNAYPKKVSKAAAKKAFEKIYQSKNGNQIIQAIAKDLEKRKQFEQWKKDNGKYIPHASTYLNGQLWLDEYTINPANNKGSIYAALQEMYQEEKEKETVERDRAHSNIWNLSG